MMLIICQALIFLIASTRVQRQIHVSIYLSAYSPSLQYINLSCITALICSGHGVCIDDGKCTCDAAYMGTACHIPKCPNNCSYPNGHCDRERHRCICTNEYAGSDCKQKASHGYWETIDTDTKSFSPPGSASHGSATYGDTMFVIGGT